MLEAPFGFAIDYAGTPGGPAACQGNRVSQHTESLTKLVDIQRPHAEVQSNKPKLQSRWPSGPTSRFKVFLFPPAAIGAVAYIFTGKPKMVKHPVLDGTT